MSALGYVNMAVQLFQRSNPLTEILQRLNGIVAFISNYQSNIKLNKYRQSLYMQQLNRMEGYIATGSPYQFRGEKIDRRF